MLPPLNIKEKSIDSALFLSPPNNWEDTVVAMKPGAHLLLFNNVRDHHVGTIAAEDNGLEIRDTLAYVFANSENGGSNVAMQLIAMARKPLQGTVAENVLEHGTGALNVDGCRIGTSKNVPASVSKKAPANCYGKFREAGETLGVGGHNPNLGRWPANLIHDGSDEVVKLFPANAGASAPVKGSEASMASVGTVTGKRNRVPGAFHSDAGSAARFFYSAPCLNDLCSYLLRLITPPNGTVFTNCNTDDFPKEYNYVTDCRC